jgi:hypothetical protein
MNGQPMVVSFPPFTPSPSHAAGIPYPLTPGRGRAGEYYELRTTAAAPLLILRVIWTPLAVLVNLCG